MGIHSVRSAQYQPALSSVVVAFFNTNNPSPTDGDDPVFNCGHALHLLSTALTDPIQHYLTPTNTMQRWCFSFQRQQPVTHRRRRSCVQPAAIRPRVDHHVHRRRSHLQPHSNADRDVPWASCCPAVHSVRQGLPGRTVGLGVRRAVRLTRYSLLHGSWRSSSVAHSRCTHVDRGYV